MKRYETPMVELTKFDIKDDILTTSGDILDAGAAMTDSDAKSTAVADIGRNLDNNNLNGVLSW